MNEEELQQQNAEQATEADVEAVGTDGDIDWNEESVQDEQEAKIAQLEAAIASKRSKSERSTRLCITRKSRNGKHASSY